MLDPSKLRGMSIVRVVCGSCGAGEWGREYTGESGWTERGRERERRGRGEEGEISYQIYILHMYIQLLVLYSKSIAPPNISDDSRHRTRHQ